MAKPGNVLRCPAACRIVLFYIGPFVPATTSVTTVPVGLTPTVGVCASVTVVVIPGIDTPVWRLTALLPVMPVCSVFPSCPPADWLMVI